MEIPKDRAREPVGYEQQAKERAKPFEGRVATGRPAPAAENLPVVYSGRLDTGVLANQGDARPNLVAVSMPVDPSPLGDQPSGGFQLHAGRKGGKAAPKLAQDTKDVLEEVRKSFGKDPKQVAALNKLAESAVFASLTEAQQKDVLKACEKNPSLVGELNALLANATFKGLDPARQSQLVVGVAQQGSAEAYLRSLDNTQLLTLAESAGGPKALSALSDVMKAGGLTAAEQAQVERIGAATYTPGAALTLSGNAADRATVLHMLRREILTSPGLRALVNTIDGDAAHPVTLRIGRNQPGHFVDAFNGGGTNTLDLADLENWPQTPPATNPEAMTQGQNLTHLLAEARQGALGNNYIDSHTEAIRAENLYRANIGQTDTLRPPPDDTATGVDGSVIFQFTNGYREEVKVDGAGTTITGIVRHNPLPPPKAP